MLNGSFEIAALGGFPFGLSVWTAVDIDLFGIIRQFSNHLNLIAYPEFIRPGKSLDIAVLFYIYPAVIFGLVFVIWNQKRTLK